MYNASDLRKGLKIEIDGDPCMITHFEFSKPGKGQALYRCKIKNLISQNSFDKTFRSVEKVHKCSLMTKDFIFSYIDGDNYIFSDIEKASSKLALVSSPTFQKRLFRTFEIIVIKHFDDLSQELLNKFNIFVYDGITDHQKYLLSSNSNCTKVVSVGNAHQFNLIWDGIDTVRSLIRIPDLS